MNLEEVKKNLINFRENNDEKSFIILRDNYLIILLKNLIIYHLLKMNYILLF